MEEDKKEKRRGVTVCVCVRVCVHVSSRMHMEPYCIVTWGQEVVVQEVRKEKQERGKDA